ncbi:hypothetical protein Unana1_07862 [Umbelopsis nana]
MQKEEHNGPLPRTRMDGRFSKIKFSIATKAKQHPGSINRGPLSAELDEISYQLMKAPATSAWQRQKGHSWRNESATNPRWDTKDQAQRDCLGGFYDLPFGLYQLQYKLVNEKFNAQTA